MRVVVDRDVGNTGHGLQKVMCNEDGGPSLELYAIHDDVTVVGMVEDEPLERRNNLVLPDGEVRMESGRVRRGRSSTPHDAYNIRERRGGHRKQVEESRGVLRKEDDVTFDREIRRGVPLLETDDHADNVCTCDQQLLDPGETLQFVGLRANPSIIREGHSREPIVLEVAVTGTTKIEAEIVATIGLRRVLHAEGIDHDAVVIEVSDAAGKVERNQIWIDDQTG